MKLIFIPNINHQISRYYENEYERSGGKDSETYSMRRHHYLPTIHSPVQLDRYDKAYAEKGLYFSIFKAFITVQISLLLLLLLYTENGQVYQRKLARVLFDFLALATRELSVKKGDLVLINRPVNHNWVEVEDTYSGLIVCNQLFFQFFSTNFLIH